MCRDDKRNFTERYKIVKPEKGLAPMFLTFLTPQDSYTLRVEYGELTAVHTETGCTFYFEDKESIDVVHPYLETLQERHLLERIEENGTVSE